MAILPTFFWGGGNISQGNVLYDTQERKNAFLDYKGKKFQRGKPIVLVQKWPFFQLFFLGNIGQENVFYDILERKNAFLSYKNKKF